MNDTLSESITKAKKFLDSGDYPEAVERSFKVLESSLQDIFAARFHSLKIDTQIAILNDLKSKYSGKVFNDIMIGEKLRLFDDFKILSNFSDLSRDININRLLEINKIRIDSTHQKRRITQGDAYLVYSQILCFIEKISSILGVKTLFDEKEVEERIIESRNQDKAIFDNLPPRDYFEFIGREDKI